MDELTRLGLGGAALAGLFEPVPEQQAWATVRAALDHGLRYVDTAPHYGAGASERLIGKVLREEPRDSFVLSTKVGRILEPAETPEDEGFVVSGSPMRRRWDFSRDGVHRSLEDSLERLGLDRVDIVYLHDPDDHEDEVYATAFPALAELRDQGVVRAIGAGMNQTAMLTRFVRRLDLDVVLCAGRYTLLDRSAEEDLLPACLDRGVRVVIGGVYNSGLLIDPKPGARFDYAPAADALVRRAAELERICASHGVPLRAAALQFPGRHPAVASTLAGGRSPREIEDNVAMAELPIPAALWEELG
jgi:D-threo-aldose 1-dehydrogenase